MCSWESAALIYKRGCVVIFEGRPKSSNMRGFQLKIVKSIVKNYLDNSSIHGLRYLAEKDRMVWERLFWLTAVIASCYGTLLLTKSSYDAYNDHPISFATETDYLYWNTNFPAVSVCERDNPNMIVVEEYVKKAYPDKIEDYDFHGLVYSIVYSTGNCEECKVYCREQPDACRLNFKKMMFDIRLPCEQLLKDCRWNKESFNCCSKFIPIESERGLCLAANTIHTVNRAPLMISNKDTGPGVLEFKVTRFSE
ncbi:Pickpocket protein 28, partial [Gryllus bimaculatus]